VFLFSISYSEDDGQLDFDALEHLENPDLHVGSIHAIKLYNKIKEMLNSLECPKKYTFNFADLLKPDPHRTEFFLGALLNFCLDRFVTLTYFCKKRQKKPLKHDLIVKFFQIRDGRLNAISEIVDEFNALEQKIVEIEENKITQVYNSE